MHGMEFRIGVDRNAGDTFHFSYPHFRANILKSIQTNNNNVLYSVLVVFAPD